LYKYGEAKEQVTAIELIIIAIMPALLGDLLLYTMLQTKLIMAIPMLILARFSKNEDISHSFG
jgi:hypothetical protein